VPFVQKKNSPLADRRFAHFAAEVSRHKAGFATVLSKHLAQAALRAITLADISVEKAMRAFARRWERRYGLSSSLFRPNGERECARRRRQIQNGIITKENGLYLGRIEANRLIDV
jgi:hypothetical protein